MRKYLFESVTIVFISLLLLELTLNMHYLFLNKTLSRKEAIMYRENMVNLKIPIPFQMNPKRDWENTLVIHPLFGYVYDSRLRGINNFGFNTRYDFSMCKAGYCLADDGKDKIVVGIFGGSFAEQAGLMHEYVERKLTEIFPSKKTMVINMAIGGYSLPQTVFTFIYFKDLFDVIIFIDGLNEIWNPIENNRAGCPPEFAKVIHFNYKRFLVEGASDEITRLTERVIKAKRQFYFVTRFSLLPVVRQSLIVHYCWERFCDALINKVNRYSSLIVNRYESRNRFFALSDEDICDFSVKKWKDYHELIHEIASSKGILDIHILQPNPYIAGSKALTRRERKLILHSYNIENYVILGYPKLQKAVLDLRNKGVPAEDLSYIFQDVQEDIWVDACHPNQLGYSKILDRISEIVNKNKDSILRNRQK